MALLDMFDKLDDIVYKPVEAISDWIKEPLKKWEHKRAAADAQQAAELETERAKQQMLLELQREEEAAKIQVEQRKWNAEIDNMIAEQEIFNIVKQDTQNAVENLVDKAKELGGYDNITVIIITN